MKLKNILEGIDIVHIDGSMDINIDGIAYDSRKVNQGDVFVCISGYKTDGHQYIKDAIEKGAAAIVVEKNIDVQPNTTVVIQVPDTREALSKLSSDFYNHPTKKLKIFGVTGTNGKTTITYMINKILETAQISCSVLGTISYKIGKKEYNSPNTTPESYELQKMFNEMINENIQACAMEVSSHSLALKRVNDIDFDYGIFTNLTPDHLDFHHDFEHYYNSKKELFLKTTQANIINVDDDYGKKLVHELHKMNTKCLTYAIDESADYKAENVQISERFSDFDISKDNDIIGHIKLPIPGTFSVYNALAATVSCLSSGIGFETIKKGLESLKGVPGRFEVVENKKGKLVIVDYAHTPDALEKVLNTANGFKKGRLICVFGCGGERDRTKRPLMGKAAGTLSDYCIITSDNPRNEDPKQILHDTEEGIIDTGCQYEIIQDRYDAIKRAIEICGDNDLILLAGKGHETYQVLGNESIHFDDREVVREIINGK